ncbi:cell division control protein 48 homolog C-like isoform X3 [Rhododendron vialii]|uniref:cell division control protein 48 homolog C-like isoform X3 n=1 Tax=Rhododendron vialii TaxID=182163 RepID=UPI00265EC2AE|nr:cell division control protein 48 homolog C-like isoform X3 [Rhododendron vialii]
MNSKETNTNKSNLPSGPSSPKRRKMEKVKQTMQNGQQIPITTGNQTNTSNPPSQFLPAIGLGATPVSPVNYFLRDQLLRRSLRQQQRLTNGAPMVPKCSMQQTSKALDTKDNNAPIPADPVSSQAGQGDESIKRKEVLLGIPTPCSKLLSKHPLQVVEDANRKAPTSAISPSTAAPIKDIVSGILDGRGILVTFGNFPYYLCDRTKHALVASFFLHRKHKEYARCNADAGRFRIIFSGPKGSRIYQEKLAMALAHHVGAKLLVLGNSFFPADMSTMGIGPSRDVLWTHFRHRATQSLANPSHSEMNNHSFKKGDRVVFVGSNSGGLRLTDSPRGPTFGSLGEIVSTSQVSYLSKLGVRFDNPIHGGLDLGGQCKAGYGFNCNANELCLDPTTLKDFDKSITNNYLEAIMCASRDSPLILFVKDVDKFVQESSEAYLVVKYLINKLPVNVFVIGSQTDTENNKETESYFGKYEKDMKLTLTAKLLSNLFPNQIPIEMPEDEKHIAVLKHKFSEDSELIIAKENITCLRNVLIRSGLDSEELEELSIVHQTLTYESAKKVVKWALGYQLMEYPQSIENPNLVLSLESVEYGVNVLRETQPELKTSEKLLKDVVTENGFEKNLLGEVIPPNEAGVKFDDVGALENVKDTLKELVMLPLQRPELFCKGQLRKPCKGILLFGPPGTGKTMLAKAIATEAGANFINISASTIASKWYGDAEKYVRAVFSLAIKISPSIIFVDEVDSLLGHRGNHEHELTRRIKNEFMLNWDGLRTKDGERVLVLAATNRPFDLDEAVIRRMPRRFMVNLPDAPNRTKILQVILEKEELSPDVDFDVISRMTDGYSGSDLKNLCVTAAYCPIREILQSEKQKNAATVPDVESMPALNNTSEIRPISMEDFKYAREQISASFSTESMNMSELLKWNELYGEGGSRRKTTLSYFL